MDTDLDLRRVRYFVAVADELSFVRAAARLHMTQPALSRQIRALEDDLGVVLFDRDRQGTELTRAGQQLLEDARPMLASSAALLRRVRVAARDENHFTIGFMPGVIVTPIIAKFSSVAPHLVVEVVHTSLTDQVEYVLDGRVDVCFVRMPIRVDRLKVTMLFPEPRVAAVPASHPAAKLTVVPIAELADVPLMQEARDVPEWPGTDSLKRAPATIEEQLEYVASGAGFAVLPAGMTDFYRRPDVAYVALSGVAPRMVALAQSEHRMMPELNQFAAIAREMLGPGDE